jgi:hypothetical protein
VVLVRRTDVPEEHIASFFRVTRLRIFPVRSEEVPHDGRRREYLAPVPPHSILSVAVELLLIGRCFVQSVLIGLTIEEHYVGSKTAAFWDVFAAVTMMLPPRNNQSLVTLKMEAYVFPKPGLFLLESTVSYP